jgi:hypothetical protein
MNSINNNMNYEEFLNFKENILKNNPNLLNLANNNLYEHLPFSNLIETVKVFDNLNYPYHNKGKVHRCHLVEEWLNIYQISSKYKSHIGFSKGVKNSFEIISQDEKFKYKKWLIPSDVYPYYSKTLSKTFTPIAYYETLIDNDVPFYYQPNISDDHFIHEADVILITLPLKPLGINGNDNGFKHLKSLVQSNPNKTFIFDCVYLNPCKNNITENIINSIDNISYLIELYDLGNVFLLTSLSKSWSMPNIMGITFIPEKFIFLREKFKSIIIEEDKLKLAYLALNRYILIPSFISSYLKELRNNLDSLWQERFYYSFFKNLDIGKKHFGNISLQESYLYYVNIEPELFLEENILVIPSSVFGGKNGSVISILCKDLDDINQVIKNLNKSSI